MLRTDHMKRLDVLEEFGDLVEVQARVYGTVNTLHGQRLVRCQGIQVREIRFSKDDCIQAGFTPQLHKVHDITEPQRRMSGKHDTRLAKLAAEISMNTGIMFQFIRLDQLQDKHTQ